MLITVYLAIMSQQKNIGYGLMKPNNLRKNANFTMLANQQTNDHVDIYLYGIIGGWDNTPEDFASTLSNYANLKTITVYIFSVGGYFEAGLPIFNLLRQHPAEVTTVVIGYALSMASYVMLAADAGKVKAASNALIMIHRAQGYGHGSADELVKLAEVLALHEMGSIAEYDARLKIGKSEVLSLMQAETWYTAQDALDAGLIDEITDAVDTATLEKVLPSNVWKYAKDNYQYVPVAIENRLNPPSMLTKIINAVAGEPPQPITLPINEIDMTPEELKAALEANNAQIISAVDEKINAAMLAIKTEQPSEPEKPTEAELLAQAHAEIEALKVENLALKTPVKTTELPENMGGVADIDNSWA